MGVCTLRSARQRRPPSARPPPSSRGSSAASSPIWSSRSRRRITPTPTRRCPRGIAAAFPRALLVRLLGGGRHRRRPRGRGAPGAVADGGVAAGRDAAAARLRPTRPAKGPTASRRGAGARSASASPSTSDPQFLAARRSVHLRRRRARRRPRRRLSRRAARSGGLASGGSGPGQNALWAGERVQRVGAVGVAMTGDIAVDTIVAQGCRPIGDPMPMTRADGHVVRELGGKAPVAVMRAMYDGARQDRQGAVPALALRRARDGGRARSSSAATSSCATSSASIPTRARSPSPPRCGRGRCCSSSCATPRPPSTICRRSSSAFAGRQPAGALLFSCVGRGQGLFGRADHDTDLFRARVGARAARRLLLQRRDRPRRRADLLARLHLGVRALPPQVAAVRAEPPLVCLACRARTARGRELFTLSPADGAALVCDNPACRRRYPIVDGVPVIASDVEAHLRALGRRARRRRARGAGRAPVDLSRRALGRLRHAAARRAGAGGSAWRRWRRRLAARAAAPVERAVELGCGVGRGALRAGRGAATRRRRRRAARGADAGAAAARRRAA